MEGKITEKGSLQIKRARKYKPQRCPWDSGPEDVDSCGDWCPLFRITGTYASLIVELRCAPLLSPITILRDERDWFEE